MSPYRFTTLRNRIPTTRSRWLSVDGKSKTGNRVHPERKASIVSASIEPTEEAEVNVEPSLTQQDNEGYIELYSSVCNNTVAREVTLQNRHSDKVPTFAMARIGGQTGAAHAVCIDTGSAISRIEAQYLKKKEGIPSHQGKRCLYDHVERGRKQPDSWMN
jgi:hypothetical protein